MNATKKSFAYWLEVAAVGIVLGLILQGARAWTEPGANPPGGNLGAPINTSSNPQTKSGNLVLGGLGVTGSALVSGNLGVGTLAPTQKLDVAGYVKGQSGLCIGDDCRSSWPSGGQYVSGGLYGYCVEGGGEAGGAVEPAYLEDNSWCRCRSGYSRIATVTGASLTYSCSGIDPCTISDIKTSVAYFCIKQ